MFLSRTSEIKLPIKKKEIVNINKMTPNPGRKENILKESEEKYKLMLDNAYDLITIINDKFVPEYINEKAYLDLLGYSKEDIIGKSPLLPFHPDDHELAINTLKKGFKNGEGKNEIRVKHKDGNYICLESKGRTFIDANGKRKVIIISRDITRRKETEQKLRYSEEKYRSLINDLIDIILEVDLKGVVTYVSPQCFDLIGYHPHELIGTNALKFIYRDDVSIIADSMKNAFKTKTMISVSIYRLVHKNGDNIFVSARGKYVNVNGTEKFIIVIRDLTIQKKIEHNLRLSEEKSRLISENATDIISIINKTFQLVYINEIPLLEIGGYSVSELIGKSGIDLIHPDDREKTTKLLLEGFKTGECFIETRIKHKLGHYFISETNGKLFIDKDGEGKLLLFIRDITKRKNAENKIIAENKELRELSQIKSELITKASHEFKTPLSSIYAASQFLIRDYGERLDGEVLDFLKIIHRGGRKLKQLIENLLDVSNVESDNLNLHFKKENLTQLINECITDLMYLANERSICIRNELQEEINLEIDRIRIEQVMNNLLTNAIKNTPPEGKIYINSRITSKSVEISIKDTGVGLTKKEKELLFQKFKKFNRDIKRLDIENEGSGLGLYISKEIIELHNGSILVVSEGRNKGSTFTIRLPNSN